MSFLEEVTCAVVLGGQTRTGAKMRFQQKEQPVRGLGLGRVNILATPWSQSDWEGLGVGVGGGGTGDSLGVVRDGARE